MNFRSSVFVNTHRRLLTGSFALCLTLASVGCERANWEDPAYISQKLQEGDITEKRLALEKYRELSEEEQLQVVPALAGVYLNDDGLQRETMSILVQLRHVDAADAYLKEVQTNATNYAGAAAQALGVAGVKTAMPQMLELLKTTDSNDIKEAILQGFTHMPDASQVPAITEILQLDVDNNPIALHSYGCDVLGAIAQDSPDAFDEKAVRTLVRATYLANNVGQNVGRECGLAVQQLGAKAIPVLLETFAGNNDDVKSLLMMYNRPPKYDFPENFARIRAAVMLTAMRAQEAVEPFIADLKADKSAPDSLSGNHAVQWRMKEGQVVDEVINGLGDIADSSGREVLEQVMLGNRNRAWTNILDGLVELQLRQNAALALNRLGDRSALPALLRAAREGVIVDLERRFVMLERAGQPASILERYQFNWMAAQAFANLAGADQRANFERLIKTTKEKELKEKYESFLPMFELAEKCEKEADDKAKSGCYAAALADDSELVREKAAYELIRLPADVIRATLAKELSTDKLDTREILTLGLYHAPSKEAVATIDALLSNESNKSGSEYRRDHYRLRMAKAWILNNLSDNIAAN